MATKTQNKQEKKIQIYLPLLPDEGGSVAVDQTVNVEVNGKTTVVRRGEYCEVPLHVYEALYNSGRFDRL